VLTHRISAWAGPVTGTVAVLCAAIAIAYASGTRVDVSIPAAADVGGAAPTGASSDAAAPSKKPALTFVYPTHPVQVLDEPDDVSEATEGPVTPSSSPRAPSATPNSDDNQEPSLGTSPGGTPAAIPTVSPTPDSSSPEPTDTWSDDDPSRTPGPSQWKPTGTPSWSPSASHSHDDSQHDGTSGASQSDS